MKRFKNVSNRHLQFFYAKVEMAPGQQRDVDDEAFKGDPGFKACIESGYLEEVKESKSSKSQARSSTTASKDDSDSKKADQANPDKGQQPKPDDKKG